MQTALVSILFWPAESAGLSHGPIPHNTAALQLSNCTGLPVFSAVAISAVGSGHRHWGVAAGVGCPPAATCCRCHLLLYLSIAYMSLIVTKAFNIK